MAAKQLQLKVYTPTKTVAETSADFVLLRTREGEMGVLPNHEPCSVALAEGVLKTFVDRKETEVFAVLGGFAIIRDDEVVVLSELADYAHRIEQTLSEMEHERAEVKRTEQTADLEIHRAEKGLRRALVGMDISSFAIIKGNAEKSELDDLLIEDNQTDDEK